MTDSIIPFAIIVGIFCVFLLTMAIIDYINTKKALLDKEIELKKMEIKKLETKH